MADGEHEVTRTRGHSQAGRSAALLIALSGGPRTLRDLEDAFLAYGRRVPGDPRPGVAHGRAGSDLLHSVLERDLDRGMQLGWVVRRDDAFTLTDEGSTQAQAALAVARSRRRRIHRFLAPSRAAGTAAVIQLGITALKVPAAVISGSLAQINDAIEEVLDVVTSAMVYLGIKFDRQRAANVVLVAVLLLTASLAVAFGVHRLIAPVTPTVSWYPVTVAVISLFLYTVRSAYERAAGLRGVSPSLISQSIDSRNHALVSASVVGSLFAAAFHVDIVDTLVGLSIALLILKSAVSLAVEVVRATRQGAQPDLTSHSLWLADRLYGLVGSRRRAWLLAVIDEEPGVHKTDLLRRANRALSATANPLIREFGIDTEPDNGIDPLIDDLIEDRFVALDATGRMRLTESGRRHLRRSDRKHR